MKLRNPAIIITGGAKRLGLEFAKKSLAMGFDVILHYRSIRRPADQWLNQNRQYKPRVCFIRQDLALGPAGLIDSAKESASVIAGLVNSASTFTKGNLGDANQFFSMLEINTFAPLILANRFAACIKNGWIINITDAHIQPINHAYQNYRMTKLFLTEITRQLASLYAPRIRVNAIAPGAILPANTESGAENFKAIAGLIPLRRSGAIENILQSYEYLIKNDYVTGQVLYVDGGWHLSR